MKKLLIILVVLASCITEKRDVTKNNIKNDSEKTVQKDTTQIITILLTESEKLAKNKKIDEARQNINQAIKLSKSINSDLETANSLFYLSKLEFKYGIPQIAELSFEKAKEIYKSKDMKAKIIELNTFGLELYKYLGKEEKVNEIINNSFLK